MKKLLVSGLLLTSLLATSITTFAIDKRITASNHYVKVSSYNTAYAYGYTTSDTYHYTSTRLYAITQGQTRTSSRNWGTGCIGASTSGVPYSSMYSYGSDVYYGF